MGIEAKNAVVGVFDSHEEAERAVKALERSGLPIKQLSIVGKDYHTEEHVVGYYNAGNRMAYWGKLGAFWGGLWGVLFGAAFFWVPGIGPVLVGGPLVAAIVGALEGAAMVGGLTAIGAGLYSIGIPKDSVLRYETALRADKFLLLVHGSGNEVEKAREIMDQNKAVETAIHNG
ncbi:MAG: general stress protein [Myxococcota bacterium]